MPVTELYAFNLICENLLAALYGVALNMSSSKVMKPIYKTKKKMHHNDNNIKMRII